MRKFIKLFLFLQPAPSLTNSRIFSPEFDYCPAVVKGAADILRAGLEEYPNQYILQFLTGMKTRLCPSSSSPSLKFHSTFPPIPQRLTALILSFWRGKRGETRLQDKKNRRSLFFWAYLSPLLISVFTGAFARKQQRNCWTSENNKEEGQTHIITYYRKTI